MAPSLEQLVAGEQLSPTALVRLSMERAVAAKREGDSVQVVEFRQEEAEWVRQELARFAIGDAVSSLNLLSLDGDTGDEWNTWVFGTAPDGVSRVELAGYEGEGGRVVDGAWVIVLRDRGLTPDDITWRFVDSLGAVLDSGVGIFPPSA